jgi:hypothetical protein
MNPIFIALVAFAELFAFFVIPRFIIIDSKKYNKILSEGDDDQKAFLLACIWELIIFNVAFLIGIAVGAIGW